MSEEPALSPETALLLAQFLGNGGHFDEDEGENTGQASAPGGIAPGRGGYDGGQTACVAYRAEDVSAITATMLRLATKHEERDVKQREAASARVLLHLEATQPGGEAFNTLQRDGVLRLNEICSGDLCDRLLADINANLAREVAAKNPQLVETGFGPVLCRESRADMYLPNPVTTTAEGQIYHEVLASMFSSSSSPLSLLFHQVFDGHDSSFHEFSSLISDSGAASQPIHPDTQHDSSEAGFSVCGPMYTVFLALQDVDEEMGPTIFLPRTNNQQAHEAVKSENESTKADFLAGCEYRMALLRKGDCAIMDSRCLHMGAANYKGRRVLLYLTLRHHELYGASTPPIPQGSMLSSISPAMNDFRPRV